MHISATKKKQVCFKDVVALNEQYFVKEKETIKHDRHRVKYQQVYIT